MNLADYIRQAAAARGIDPNIALRVASGEGGLSNPFRHGEGPAPRSQAAGLGATENSYGPFQLYISGTGAGLGDRALAAGIDPRKNWQGGVDFALDEAKRKGWGQWYGAKAQGITGMMGIGGAPSPYAALPDGPKGQEMYSPPQSPGLAPATQTASPLGAVPSDVATFASSDETKSPLQSFFSALAKTPDAPPVRFRPMGDARDTGSALLKQLQATPIAQLLLRQRLG